MGDRWETGRVIAGRYRLEARIGSGGMGEVWRAEHTTLRSPVAIKVLRGSMEDDEDASARFLREARAAAALRSSNVVQVLDYGVEGGMAYIAMEFLDGESLSDRLANGPLPHDEAARILTQTGRAVARAHKKGIVHRDLKPANIQLVPEDGADLVKVLDFGIAKLMEPTLDETADTPEITSTGTMLGTPYYMSPEQLRGRRTIDERSDIWSLGIIAYECVVGARPFDGETIGDLVLTVCAGEHPKPSDHADVPDGFDAWFARATAIDPDARFASVQEQVKALRQVLLDESPPMSRQAVAGFDASQSRRTSPSSAPPGLDTSDVGAAAADAEGSPPSGPLADTAQAQTLSAAPEKRGSRSLWLAALALLAVAGVGAFVATRSTPSAQPDAAAAAPAAESSEAQPETQAAPHSDTPASEPTATDTAEPASVEPDDATATTAEPLPAAAPKTPPITPPPPAPPKQPPSSPPPATQPQPIDMGF